MDAELPTEVETSPTQRSTRSSVASDPQTPGSRTCKKVSDRSRADYSVYLLKDAQDKTRAVLIETKLSSSASFEHAVAQVSPWSLGWVALAPFSFSLLQVIGYHLKFATESCNPPLCFVLSELSAQLVCFPFVDKSNKEAVDCLVLPPLPLFLRVQVDGTRVTSYFINKYLLALLLLWTRPNNSIYHVNEGMSKPKLMLHTAVKKSLVKSHILSNTEKLQLLLDAAREQTQEAQEQREQAQEQREQLEQRIKALEGQLQEACDKQAATVRLLFVRCFFTYVFLRSFYVFFFYLVEGQALKTCAFEEKTFDPGQHPSNSTH